MTDKPDPDPGPLAVRATKHPGQYVVENSPAHRYVSMWERTYVSFSGYFGAYGPYMFAAAPEMLEALEKVEAWLLCADIAKPEDMAQSFGDMLSDVQAALAKARPRRRQTHLRPPRRRLPGRRRHGGGDTAEAQVAARIKEDNA